MKVTNSLPPWIASILLAALAAIIAAIYHATVRRLNEINISIIELRLSQQTYREKFIGLEIRSEVNANNIIAIKQDLDYIKNKLDSLLVKVLEEKRDL